MERDMFETARLMGMDESNTCFCFGERGLGRKFVERRISGDRVNEIKSKLSVDVDKNYIISKWGFTDFRGFRLICFTEFYDIEATLDCDKTKIVKRFLNKLMDCLGNGAGRYLEKLFRELAYTINILYHGCPDLCDIRESQRIIKVLYSENFEVLEHNSGKHTGTPGVKNLFEKIVDMDITVSRNIFIQISLQLSKLY